MKDRGLSSSEAGKPVGRIGPKTDRDRTNAEKIIFTLIASGRTVAAAESMTAGGFGYALTRVPGSSKVFVGGVVVYTRAVKQMLLGIPDEICDRGMVTQEMALELARRAMSKFGTWYGVGVTGNAGPTSDAGKASVGRVYWAAVDKFGNEKIEEFDFFGSRDDVRTKAVTAGLRLLRNFIEGGTGDIL
jgi:PncC family amidohydrolase